MSVTVNYDTEAKFICEYEDDEGEECSFNAFEMDVSASTIVSLLKGLGCQHEADDYGTGSVYVQDLIEAILEWDGQPLVEGKFDYLLPEVSVSYIVKLGMIAAASHAKGIEKVTWA